MNSLEKSLQDLLKGCEPLLKVNPNDIVANKWFLTSDSRQEVRQVKYEQKALFYSFARAFTEIIKLPSYLTCQHFFEKDNIFSDAPRLAGYWGTFRAVLQDIICECGRIRKGDVILNIDIAIDRLSELQKIFAASNIHFTSTARLLGVKLRCKKITLPDGLELYRLNRKERNACEQFIGPFSSDYERSLIAFQPTELRISSIVPVNRSKENAFFDTNNEASAIAAKAFDNILDAILLVKEGNIEIGPQSVKGGPIEGAISFRRKANLPINLNVNIRKSDAKNIITAYELITGKSEKIDRIISRALHRFLIGRKRRDAVDKLIDYVISWESILLTQKGNEIPQELSYRFSINGSSLIAAFTNGERKKLFQKMKSIYSLRSRVVHGGGERDINKELMVGEFENINEACRFLENNFRAAIWWLIGIDKNERPYKQNEGWEGLLWPK